MIHSRVLRWIVAAASLLSAAFMAWLWHTDPSGSPLVTFIVIGIMLLLAVAMAVPRRVRWPLRLIAGVIGGSYALYFTMEAVLLFRGQRQPLSLGQPSATMAGIALVIWAIPMLVFAITGRLPRQHRRAESASARERELQLDIDTIAALADAGRDLSLETTIRFFVRTPDEGHARSVAQVARQHGYQAEVVGASDAGEGAGAAEWCAVTVAIVPTLASVQAARDDIARMVRPYAAEVVGWEAAERPSGTRSDGQE